MTLHNMTVRSGFLLESYRVPPNTEYMVDGFGNVVYEGISEKTEKEVWVKVIKKTSAAGCRVGQEVTALKRLTKSGARCTRLVDFLESGSHYYIVTRRGSDKVSLLEFLTIRGCCHELDARLLFHKILKAVDECHRAGVCHRALTLETIFVHLSGKGPVEIVDFSSASCAKEHTLFSEQPCLTAFTAPEVLAGQLYWGELADVWSLGVTLYALLIGKVPFGQGNQLALLQNIRSAEVDIPEHFSELARECLLKAMCTCAEDRPTVEEYLNHPWLRSDESDTPSRSSMSSSPDTSITSRSEDSEEL
ncbi:SNF1-related protein kinase catalytic subunit alpha KIN10 [Diplonema papillatum]|nr:SNF1-related protein kinase catalytic subunit alpha KIN10 [Diplonema papillatum]|eukprot:gene8773-13593_t